jgi:methanogenic corrinoid protein MtbC1
MVECVLAGLGWQTTDLGADIPFSSLARAAGELKPRLIWLSISTPVNPDTFIPAYSDFQRTADAAGASIVIGGRGVTAELRSELAYASFGERMRHLVGFAECVSRPARNAPMNDAL